MMLQMFIFYILVVTLFQLCVKNDVDFLSWIFIAIFPSAALNAGFTSLEQKSVANFYESDKIP